MSWPKQAGKYRDNFKAYQLRYSRTPRGKWNIYRWAARKKGRVWELSYDFFLSLWQKPCFYCGKDMEYIGIDRKDNAIGYIETNVVPCCFSCNRMKKQKPFDEFIAQCRAISENHR